MVNKYEIIGINQEFKNRKRLIRQHKVIKIKIITVNN